MTKSEELFERLCRDRQVRFEQIPTAVDGQRRADYRVWLDDLETIVEVKQIEFSKHEQRLLASSEDEDGLAVISDVYSRIRNKFDKSKAQLKNVSGGRLPALLVLYDNTNGLSGVNNEDFMNAMHGDEVIKVKWNRNDKNRKILRTVQTFGGGRKVGEKHNQSVSALGRLLIDNAGSPLLFLFHNELAANRLTYESAKLIATKQSVRPPSEVNAYRHWTEIRVT